MPHYQLDSSKLEQGDVILEAGSGIVSSGIKLIDGGFLNWLGAGDAPAFSHVFLYVGMSLIMEADEDVRAILASRVITEHPENFRILRHPEFSKVCSRADWKIFAGQVAFIALHPEMNTRYNWSGMFATKIPFLPSAKRGFFCSQLVAEAFRRLGIRPFSSEIPPKRVTPNMFVTSDCLLQQVKVDCFTELPMRAWTSELLRNRYDVMKAEPIPLAQMSYQISQDMVRVFGKRVDDLTRKIGLSQTIATPLDLYLTLTFPDLRGADEVSDDVVLFMNSRYPTKQIADFVSLSKASIEHAISWNDRAVNETVARTLRRDISAVEQMLPMFEQQIKFIDELPLQVCKRSIHVWLRDKTAASLASELDHLSWRKDTLKRVENLL